MLEENRLFLGGRNRILPEAMACVTMGKDWKKRRWFWWGQGGARVGQALYSMW